MGDGDGQGPVAGVVEQDAAGDVVGARVVFEPLELGFGAEADAALGGLEEAGAEGGIGGEARLFAAVEEGEDDASVADGEVGGFEHGHEGGVAVGQDDGVVAAAGGEEDGGEQQRGDGGPGGFHRRAAGPRRRPSRMESRASAARTGAVIAGPSRPSPLEAQQAYWISSTG